MAPPQRVAPVEGVERDERRERRVEALELVGAKRWVKRLDEGLKTSVGEGGHRLTPTQAQQLALARLILADPPVAVLDEATAEAGSAGAGVLEPALDAVADGRTTIVVAHRLTQALAADRIVVLDHGRVVETGIVPSINTGIAHREPGVGQVGAGVVKAPMPCFTQALETFAAKLGVVC